MTDMKHYGILRKSGRYPWGSGGDYGTGDTETPFGRSMAFYGMVNYLKDQGIPETEIAKTMDLSVADLRSTKTIAREQIVLEQTQEAVKLRAKGMSVDKIAEQLGMEKPTVRLRLKNAENLKPSALRATAEVLRKNVEKHDIVDVGKGNEHGLGISDTKMKAALAVLVDEGYETYTLKTRNVGTDNFTNQLVLVKPGTGFKGAAAMKDRIHTMGEYTEDDGKTFFNIHPPININSSRLKVAYKEDGGELQDGVVYVRPGVPDLNMGKNRYAQVRIAIDGTHFIKGMAVQKDDLPPGVDLLFHTNKSKNDPKIVEGGKLGALKPLQRKDDGTVDQDNPFGSAIKRQFLVKDANGNEKVTSAINLVNETGDWDGWRNSLPSQMLAKQPHSLIKSQLAETRLQAQKRLEEIGKINNAVVRQKALEDYAEQLDSDAVDLRAAAMPHQRTQVLLPVPNMRKNEIYAPNFSTGDKVVLIRFPHGGRFEIPEVTVNNNSRTAKKLLGNAVDAIGIHPEVANRLSGADFDGDTVLVIPNPTGKIKGSQSMGSQAKVFDDGLKNFDSKTLYGGYKVIGKNSKGEDIGNFKLMKNTGKEMGLITNLITDMSIQGAKPEHVLRAVRHSMVVIDAEKHKLDYKKSEQDHGISQLKTLYQGNPRAGATTLLSVATSEKRIPDRQLRPASKGGPIDPNTGAKVYVDTGIMKSKYDPKTKTYSTTEKVAKEIKVKRLELEDDAFNLVRDPADPVERLYAQHSNEMKAIANQARLAAVRTPIPKTTTQAKSVYRDELNKLVSDLKAAQAQKPLDRRADNIAGAYVRAKRQEDPLLRTDRDRLKKVEREAKKAARARLGLERPVIEITDRQWDAIQAGAVSPNRLREILLYADPKRVAELSMPRTNTVMTTAISARAKAMIAAGRTTAEVAAALGVPASTLRAAALRGEL